MRDDQKRILKVTDWAPDPSESIDGLLVCQCVGMLPLVRYSPVIPEEVVYETILGQIPNTFPTEICQASKLQDGTFFIHREHETLQVEERHLKWMRCRFVLWQRFVYKLLLEDKVPMYGHRQALYRTFFRKFEPGGYTTRDLRIPPVLVDVSPPFIPVLREDFE